MRIRDILRTGADLQPSRSFAACVDMNGEVCTFTTTEFYDHVTRHAAALGELGLRPGDKCVIHLPNGPEFLFAFWALQELNVIAVPTINEYAADELEYVVNHCGAWGVITDTSGAEKAVKERRTQGAAKVIVTGSKATQANTIALDELLAARPDPGYSHSCDGAAHDEAMILYTSGTTARPKGVVLTHESSLFAADSNARHLRLQPTDRVLTCMPLFHVNAMFLQMLPAAVTGSFFVLTPKFSVSRYWDWVRDYKITVAHLVAGPIRMLAAQPPAGEDTDHFLRVMTFGLPLSKKEIVAFEQRFGVPLSMAWGLTESSSTATHMPLYLGRRPDFQSIGSALPGWRIKVWDENDGEVDAGVVGELVIRSPGVMKGYYLDPKSTTAALRGGWLHTGDLGFVDDEGYFHFVDRKKDMIKTSGENVAASEVERVMVNHPMVEECAVIGIPDTMRGEIVKAVVVPSGVIGTEELIAFCAAHLAAFKVPRVIEFATELPKTSIGKIQKGVLRKAERGTAEHGPSERSSVRPDGAREV